MENMDFHSFYSSTPQIKLNPGNVFHATEDYLLHSIPCNYVLTNIADNLEFKESPFYQKFPHANQYLQPPEYISNRSETYLMGGAGDVKFYGSKERNERFVANMFTQYYSGPSQYLNDSHELRLEFFEQAMNRAYKNDMGAKSFGMDLKIAYSIAHAPEGFLKRYHEVILSVAKKYPRVKTVLYLNQQIQQVEKAINH